MQRIAKPATNKPDFELFCLAVSAINACEMCIRSHKAAAIAGGLTEDHVVDTAHRRSDERRVGGVGGADGDGDGLTRHGKRLFEHSISVAASNWRVLT
jgi:AhpD family alkylhydroperoxidase